ncbi:DHH family phosphoesterase [Mycoplasmopsis synoviae]|nr:DHH family phosphoesterase [Mycoplasmopsis synoviae]UBX98458.1 DHH family phosphoesterase [Mycoplasmopsis synoviae]
MNKKYLFLITFLVIFVSFTVAFVSLVFLNKITDMLMAIFSGVMVFSFAGALISFLFVLSSYSYSKLLVYDSFHHLIDEVMSNNNLGILIYDVDMRIIWMSKYLKNTFKEDYTSKTLNSYLEFITSDKHSADFLSKLDVNNNSSNLEFEYENTFYETQFWYLNNIVVIRNINVEKNYKTNIFQKRSIVGEIEMDNFQLYKSIYSDEQIFKLNKVLIDSLNTCVNNYDFIYRQYSDGKFIIFTNEESFQTLEKGNFHEFFKIKNNLDLSSKDDVNLLDAKLTLSVGFARGWENLKEKLESAKKALVVAQNRGGDQVVVNSFNEPTKYFGSNTEILPTSSKTKINFITNQLKEKLQDPKIENVIVYGHQHADLDVIGSAFALCELARVKYKKQANLFMKTYDSTVARMLSLVKYKTKDLKIIEKESTAKKNTDSNTLIIIVDTSNPQRTDYPNSLANAKKENIFILDHHRVAGSINFCYEKNTYIDTTASSTCEIISEILYFLEGEHNISQVAAQHLLNGIYLDTSQFTKSMTSRTFQAAAWLEAKGAKAIYAIDMLKINFETKKLVNEIIKNPIEVKKGYFLAYTKDELDNDIISIAADEMLKVRDRFASFVIAKLKNTNKYKLSARGIETNVQIICEAVGGGGHFNTAAAFSEEELEVFVDNTIMAITSTGKEIKNESDFN